MKHHRSALLFFCSFVVAASALAQVQADADATPNEGVQEEVVVTGTRIASPNATSTSPPPSGMNTRM